MPNTVLHTCSNAYTHELNPPTGCPADDSTFKKSQQKDFFLFFKNEIYRQHQEHKSDEVIEAKSLIFKKQD